MKVHTPSFIYTANKIINILHSYIHIWIVSELCGWESTNRQDRHAHRTSCYMYKCTHISYRYRCENQCEKCTNIKWFMEILDENDVQKWWFSIVGISMPKCAQASNVFIFWVCMLAVRMCLIGTQNKHTYTERPKWRNEWQRVTAKGVEEYGEK